MADVTDTTQRSDNLPDGFLKTPHNSLIRFVGSCLVALEIILVTDQKGC
ncbi:MAG: hypothetical protein LUQ26_12410 [Methylococcaceae bacterium]|nr:hypothetical protein [Methylococcaceae bacterium]